MNDTFSKLVNKIQDSDNYLKIDDLKNGCSYKIIARNAYVGIWIRKNSTFMISRYKVGPKARLFHEHHWDTGEPYGTVMPLEWIEKCSFEIKDDYSDNEVSEMLKYLDKLEVDNPILKGYDTLQDRKLSAMDFEQRLRGNYKKPEK